MKYFFYKPLLLLASLIVLFFALSCVSQKQLPTLRAPQAVFSHTHGIFYDSFDLEISSPLANSEILYTLDCSDPLISKTAIKSRKTVKIQASPASNVAYTSPSLIVRAAIRKNGLLPSFTLTQTYFFPELLLSNSPNEKSPGKGWPEQIKYSENTQNFDYGLDTRIMKDKIYSTQIKDALNQIPIVSLVSDSESFFGTTKGIYVNANYHGKSWEREASLELLDSDFGFQANTGVRIRGGWSRHDNYPKHSFRLFFRNQYGLSKLSYPFFQDEGAKQYEKIDLAAPQNYSWANEDFSGRYNTFLRDVWSRDLQGEMGNIYTKTRFYHLLLNGVYWGIYQTQERPEADFAAEYLGGQAEDYDIIKVDIGTNWDKYQLEATDGNLKAWSTVYEFAQKGFASDRDYYALQGKNAKGKDDKTLAAYVDIDNLIDYLIIIYYTGNYDSPVSKFGGDAGPNNFYLIRNSQKPGKGFQFLVHDAEHTLLPFPVNVGEGLTENRVDVRAWPTALQGFNPQSLHTRLMENDIYKKRFAERAHKYFAPGGLLSLQKNIERLDARAKQIDLAIILEAARWGDTRSAIPRDKGDWTNAVDEIRTNFFPAREAIVIEQLKKAGLY